MTFYEPSLKDWIVMSRDAKGEAVGVFYPTAIAELYSRKASLVCPYLLVLSSCMFFDFLATFWKECSLQRA